MRIFFRPIDLFYTLSSVFLSVFSGSQSREREKKRRGKESRLDFQTLSKPRLLPRKAAIKQSATLVPSTYRDQPTLSFSLLLSLSKETQRRRDTETLSRRVRVKNFDSSFFFFNKKLLFLSFVRVFFTLFSLPTSKEKNYCTTLCATLQLLPLFMRSESKREQLLLELLCFPTRERERERERIAVV